jgi:hypothetical protein
MLEIDEDLAFARALIRRTCRAHEDRVHLITQSFSARGEPQGDLSAPDEGSLFTRFNRMLAALNDAARGALVDGRVLTASTALLAALALVLLWRAQPRRGRIDGHWTRAPRPPDTGYQALVDRYASPSVPWGYAMPATVLREEAIERVGEALGVDASALSPSQVGRRVAALCGPLAGKQASELWQRLHRIGWRESPPAQWVTGRQLSRLHELASALFDALAVYAQGKEN